MMPSRATEHARGPRYCLAVALAFVVALLVVVPALELVADGAAVEAHHGVHVHSSAGLPGEAPALPQLPIMALDSRHGTAAGPKADVHAVFVPPRV